MWLYKIELCLTNFYKHCCQYIHNGMSSIKKSKLFPFFRYNWTRRQIHPYKTVYVFRAWGDFLCLKFSHDYDPTLQCLKRPATCIIPSQINPVHNMRYHLSFILRLCPIYDMPFKDVSLQQICSINPFHVLTYIKVQEIFSF